MSQVPQYTPLYYAGLPYLYPAGFPCPQQIDPSKFPQPYVHPNSDYSGSVPCDQPQPNKIIDAPKLKKSDSCLVMNPTAISSSVSGIAAASTQTKLRSQHIKDLSFGPNFDKVKTRIVCTIGPSSNNVETMCKLMDAGMCVVRMNTAHGSLEYHQSIIDNCRAACRIKKTHCALLLDTKGPEIRTGKLLPNPDNEGKKVWTLVKGTIMHFSTDTNLSGNSTFLTTTYKNLPKIVKKGTTILCADGLISFTVLSTNGVDDIECRIENDGTIGENKNMNVPGAVIDLPAVTEKDKVFIEFGVKNKIEFIAASFIRKPQDILDIRALPGVKELDIHIISKIESQEGIDNFDEILKVTDGIMVARGDLGVEVPIQKVPGAQKLMIKKCNDLGIPVVTATQMLESMIVNPRPTRAEITDVFNAVIDGTDCVMLSGETASGLYPVECVETMSRICSAAEKTLDYRALFVKKRALAVRPISVAESIASSAVKTSWDMCAGVIVAITETGNICEHIAKYRPHCPIICATRHARIASKIMVLRGCYPYHLSEHSCRSVDTMINAVAKKALKDGFVTQDSYLTIITGSLATQNSIASESRLLKVLKVSHILSSNVSPLSL